MKLKLIIIAIAFFVIVACLNSVTTISAFVVASCDKVVKDAMGTLNGKLETNVKNLYNYAPVFVHKNTITTALKQIELFLNTSNNSISLSNNSCRGQFNTEVSKIKLGANITTIRGLIDGPLPLNATNMGTYKTTVKAIKNALGVDKTNKLAFKF